jgi:hypothetical protein
MFFLIAAFAAFIQQAVEGYSHHVNCCLRNLQLFRTCTPTFLLAEVFLDVACHVNFLALFNCSSHQQMSVLITAGN